ncbi:hypothetical protein PHISP_04497 [Aspergillus sp. HF37]|nr:hypothetical protein PHISP_04497 [Aspergillus sp. HF37]
MLKTSNKVAAMGSREMEERRSDVGMICAVAASDIGLALDRDKDTYTSPQPTTTTTPDFSLDTSLLSAPRQVSYEHHSQFSFN